MALELKQLNDATVESLNAETVSGESDSQTTLFDISHGTLRWYDFPTSSMYRKRVKTRLLTFIRSNYLRIIYALLIIILVLLLFVVIQNVAFVKRGDIAEITTLKSPVAASPPVETTSTVFGDVLTSTLRHSLITSTTAQAIVIAESSDRIPCARIHCQGTCEVMDLSYESAKYLSCCNCFPSFGKFLRYSRSVSTGEVSFIFRPNIDVQFMTDKDLASLGQIAGLSGSWDIVQESDKTFLLTYSGISIATPVDE